MIPRPRDLRTLRTSGVAVLVLCALAWIAVGVLRPTPSSAFGGALLAPSTVPRAQDVLAARAGPPRSDRSGRELRFGVYPWGAVGTFDPVAEARPDVPPRSLEAVRALKGNRQFVIRLYAEYSGTDESAAGRLLDDVEWWSSHGLQVEVVLRFRPARPSLGPAFSSWTRWVALRLAKIDGVTAVQVGNEANVTTAPGAADGSSPGAVRAIARAVPVARRAVVSSGRSDVAIGVNWAAGRRPCTTERFWSDLRRAGGPSFTAAVGWVGVDVYPGTWSGSSRAEPPSAEDVDDTVTDTIRCARAKHLPAAGLPRRVRLTVAETGYPTTPSRPETVQRTVLAATVAAVRRIRSTYGVTDLRWFALRDANTASGQLENGYGLLRDDYSEKPAFATYRDLVAEAGR